MEDPRGKNRLQNFFTTSIEDPLKRCENFMISLRRQRKYMKFNEARFGLPKDYDIIATPDEINYIKENKDNDTLIGFYN